MVTKTPAQKAAEAKKKLAAKAGASKYDKLSKAELEAELVSRGYDEADLVDMEPVELIAQLKSDDLGETASTDDAEGEEESEDSESAEDTEEETADETPTAPKGKFVDVIKGEQYIRTYSQALHGKDFMELAKQFVSKNGSHELAKPGQVKIIRVQYRIEDKKTKAWNTLEEQFTDREAAASFRNSLPGNIKVVVLFK